MSEQNQKSANGAPALKMHSIAQVQRARSLIRADEDGHYLHGALAQFWGQAHYTRVARQSTELCDRASGYINLIVEDLGWACALLRRLKSVHRDVLAGALPLSDWLLYGSIDIESFHVQLRSMFDYFAKCAGLLATKSGQAPSSFNDLLKWARSSKNHNAAGPAVLCLINDVAWFPKLRDVRDGAVHRGVRTLVFFERSEKQLFQVGLSDFDTELGSSFLATNENGVVDFRLYAAAILVETLDLLERLGAELLKQLPATLAGESRVGVPGLEVAAEYLDLYLTAPR
jgi:hypothetical protein